MRDFTVTTWLDGRQVSHETFRQKDYERAGYADNFAESRAVARAEEIMQTGFSWNTGTKNRAEWVRIDKVIITEKRS